MRLYYADGTISIAVEIALIETGLAHDLTRVDFKAAEQTKPDYLAVNPKGRVPALQTDDGRLLTETGAVLEYIAALAPGAHLVPDDPMTAAHMRSVMYYLASTMHVNHAHRMRGARWADNPDSHADMAAQVPRTMAASAAYMDTFGLHGDFVTGDTLSLADIYLFVACDWLEGDGVDVADYPQISAFMDRMEARDSVKAVRSKGML